MRLRRLELLRYGHLADAALEFPPDTALHVVHGQNEAGKSTALSAVADALFGFGHFTKYGFQYPDQLRVGFTLSDRDGRQIALVRRKGRVNTLRDAAGEPVPDQALLAFLGGASRNLFCEEFGLNAEQLRHGSQSLLASAGNAGESILAGIGLVGLRAVQDRLDADANAQLNRGRGKIPEAVKLFQDCQKTVDECSVAPKAWQEAEAAEAAASRHLDTVRAETNALATEASRLQRLRRVRSSLQALDQNRARLAALAHLPRLPATAGPRLQAAREALQLAARDHQRETDAHRSVSDALAALPKDAAILAVQDAIDALGECRGVAVQAEADLPAVRAKVEAAKTLAVAAVAELGLSEPAEAARDKVPTAAARRTAQRLINEHSGLLATHKAASEALTAATAAHDLARDVMARTPPAEAPDLMRSTIRSVRGEGHLERALVQEDAKLARATAKVEAAHRALPLWRGDLDQLAAAPLPLPADVEAAASRIGAAQTTLAERRAAAEALTGEAAELEDKLAALASGRVVPTQDAVTAARTERAQAWHLVRQHYESGPPDLTMLDRYEAAREAADALADRRADEAALVAEHQAAATRLHRLRSREQPAAQDALGAAEGAAAAAQNGWATLWNDAGLVPGAPAAMIEWRAARAELLKLAEQAREAQATRDDIAARLATARATLGRLLPVADETLEGALLRADAALAAADAQVALARERAKALEEAKRALPSRQAGRDDAAAALHRWAAAWRDAAASLGLAPTATTEDADRALDAWARIDKAAPAWRADEARVAQMTASVAAFAADVRAVQRRVGDAETDPAPVASSRLARRLAAAREAAHAAADHAARLQEHAAAIADAASRKIAAEQELAALQELTGVAAPDLETAVEQARTRTDAEVEITEHLRQLAAEGDGHDEATLRQEAGTMDADAASARLAEIAARQTELGAAREQATEARLRAEAVLADLRTGHDAAAKAQDAADALAAARAHVESYARLHVARTLLRAGVERYRKQEQGPLLRRAGNHFARLTAGRYARLDADQDASGRTILHAVRDTGAMCPVEALSEGTRDQLYLALRVAAVEAHAAHAEPLPFIADDLLVNFDDTRASAAIGLLAELGRATQVILFTHHDHIAALAGAQPGVDVQRLPA